MSLEFEMLDITIPRQQTISRKRQIPKVSLFMRIDNQKSDDYDPKVVSLGPYHHGKLELNFVEDFKPKALEMFIHGSNKKQDFFLEEILREIDDFRSCYLEEFANKYSDYEFARMMLVDACFILNDIEISTRSTPNSASKQSNTIKHLGIAVYLVTRRDLYLLENQVPFRVLKLLVKLRYDDDQGGGYHSFEEKVKSYCSQMFFDKQEDIKMKENTIIETDPPHLLEVFRRVLVKGSDDEANATQSRSYDFIYDYFPDCWRKNHLPHKSGLLTNVFRSVTDLKSKGIHFRPSGIDSLKGVRFTSHYYYGKLKLPCWFVSTYTKVFFMNMIAYELCPNGPIDRAVVSYINFMKSLVISPNDVKELREEKIIFNTLGSDEEVVQVYKGLKTYGADDPLLFKNVKRNIQEHYNSKGKTWIAELIDTYFNSPWSLTALIVTVFLTFLTIVQTYYGSPFYHSLHE
ncbi:hypothetical protein MTR67_017391 [Solanum verrucosum]|uniref:Uncharacterized protein n=2 Tax=Solanum verrucosum TaxID=315347 RepID=A0AAF0TLF8_SOLVR|nr:hypothetical protein MTR67_017391 [Solanum verrucosum]